MAGQKENVFSIMSTVFMSLIRKHYHKRYNQKDLPITIIGLPAVITLLEGGGGKKFRHDGKLLC